MVELGKPSIAMEVLRVRRESENFSRVFALFASPSPKSSTPDYKKRIVNQTFSIYSKYSVLILMLTIAYINCFDRVEMAA